MCCIFSAVSRLISGLFCSARETVEDETFARRAMSLMEVGLCTGVPVPHTFAEIRVYSNLHLSACQLTVLLSLVCPEMPLCRYLPPDSSGAGFPSSMPQSATLLMRVSPLVLQISKMFWIRLLPTRPETLCYFPLPDDRVFQHREQCDRPGFFCRGPDRTPFISLYRQN
jgi:hypothetical protein